jgi:hypothetical protein
MLRKSGRREKKKLIDTTLEVSKPHNSSSDGGATKMIQMLSQQTPFGH